jgi:hypothetical protein
MTLAAVRADWPLYKSLTQILYAALNGEIGLDDLVRDRILPPFPVNRRDDWGVWTSAAIFHLNVNRELKITAAAFKNAAGMLAASEAVAASVVVPEPTAADVALVQAGLAKINEVVKADQRFHAALAIGVALAGEIEKRKA